MGRHFVQRFILYKVLMFLASFLFIFCIDTYLPCIKRGFYIVFIAVWGSKYSTAA